MTHDQSTTPSPSLASQGADPAAKSAAAAALGRSKSDRKTAAVRINGALGGKPKGTADTEETRQRKSAAARERWAKQKAQKEAGN